MNVLDLFSGIGGFSLGLERTGGFRTVAFCELEAERYARSVLAKHWPGVQIYPDVCKLTADVLARDGICVDVVTAGFPCQDISFAGKGAGLAGERSGLWREVARLVGELRPKYVILENVSALLARGIGDVLGDLAEVGYDAEWHCIPAAAIGAPHRRDRIWIVAYPDGRGQQERSQCDSDQTQDPADWRSRGDHADRLRENVADAHGPRLERWLRASLRKCARERAAGTSGTPKVAGFWLTEPGVGRVADGIPQRVARLKALGNAVVPQIPEIIGRAILEAERHSN